MLAAVSSARAGYHGARAEAQVLESTALAGDLGSMTATEKRHLATDIVVLAIVVLPFFMDIEPDRVAFGAWAMASYLAFDVNRIRRRLDHS